MIYVVGGHTCSRHISSEAQSGDIDHQVIRGEIIEDVALFVSYIPITSATKVN